eukprot:CAMPEP_0197035002 /NCGR_PEP_ID=MMETSP1384-20130603/12910_1 /TAXON_ID=29189 /ORGANISM="Ammonia sp." /LENGTH=365 /DNA_ID=CAMNT_0042464989 /DNA_START=698 /DNA_END=1795 /DNA_ORIENTATION=-
MTSNSQPWYSFLLPNKGDRDDDQKQQCQTQTFQTSQAQAIAEKQTLIQQVDDTFAAVVLAAEMAQDPKCSEHAVNSVTDGAIISLNCMTVSCDEFHQEGKHDALDIAKKAVYDKWQQLKQTDGKTYAMTLKYHDFIMAALNGEKNLRYKESRVSEQKLFKQDAQAISRTFGRLIHQQQHFDQRQETYLDPAVNQQLEKRQQAELHEYRASNKYMNTTSKGYQRPSQQELYFTPSGQKAQFINVAAAQKQKEIDDQVCGAQDAYDAIRDKMVYANSVYFLTKNTWWPCLILPPGRTTNWRVHERISVRPAYPKNDSIVEVSVDCLQFDVNKIKFCEREHASKYGRDKLGYDSVEKQQELIEHMDVV